MQVICQLLVKESQIDYNVTTYVKPTIKLPLKDVSKWLIAANR